MEYLHGCLRHADPKWLKFPYCNIIQFFFKMMYLNRCSHWRYPIKKADLKNFIIFKEKHQCWSLFSINLHAFRPATFLKRLQQGYFPVNIVKFLRTTILKDIWERLLLSKVYPFCYMWQIHIQALWSSTF